MEHRKLGLIINPVAGLGGSVGLKGTDGMVDEALRRGALPRAQQRAAAALEQLSAWKDDITILTAPGVLGGDLARELGFPCRLIEEGADRPTCAEDTCRITRRLQQEGADLILFAGGDGTARDICSASEGGSVFLGIPAGVKIHSPVYARSPEAAGRLAALFLQGKITATDECEVLDIDEEQYRSGLINTRLYGYLPIPRERKYTQNRKCGTPPGAEASMAAMAAKVVEEMEPDTFYLIGAGTTTRSVMEALGLPNTLIGVDLVRNKQLVEQDVYGSRIMELTRGRKIKLVVTVTGGQGFLFGRGNQQLTPEVLRVVGKENLIILATRDKIFQLRGQPLLVDTGDRELDEMLSGYYPVITSYYETILCKVSPG